MSGKYPRNVEGEIPMVLVRQRRIDEPIIIPRTQRLIENASPRSWDGSRSIESSISSLAVRAPRIMALSIITWLYVGF